MVYNIYLQHFQLLTLLSHIKHGMVFLLFTYILEFLIS